ncbi:MAG TPA: hypothetical protein VK391_02420 [Allosphingosinicella sp.]|nr:hypothetical protein [Allosphingosinicella sp.]
MQAWNCGTFIPDDEGMECADVEVVRVQAAKSLAELALDVIPRTTDCLMAVDVQNERQEVVLVTELTFKAQLLVGSDGSSSSRS